MAVRPTPYPGGHRQSSTRQTAIPATGSRVRRKSSQHGTPRPDWLSERVGVLSPWLLWKASLPNGQIRLAVFVFLLVTVEATTTSTAETRMATIQRTQSMPLLPSPPKAL